MGQCVFFVPATAAVNDAKIETLRLDRTLKRPFCQGAIDTGPGGASGTLLRADCEKGPLKYDDRTQLWFPAAEKKYWLGFEAESPPGPADLIRDRFVTGRAVTLADGNEWICPTARLIDGIPKLPMRLGMDADGNDTAAVVSEYAGLWDLACEIWGVVIPDVTGEGEAVIPAERAISAAVTCLAANYHVDGLIVKAMGLLSTENIHEILRVLVDFDNFRAMLAEFHEKKKSPHDDLDGVGGGAETELSADDGGNDDAGGAGLGQRRLEKCGS